MCFRRDVIIYNSEDDEYKLIDGFPGYYITETGDIIGPGRYGEPHLLIPTKTKYGHEYVTLYRNGKKYRRYVHRLVAETFIPNPNNYPVVRHLNSCPFDNAADNLSWGTQKDNIEDMREAGNNYTLTNEDRRKAYITRRTPIKAINIKTGEQIIFKSQQEASRILNIGQGDISHIASGKSGRQTRNGYKFEKIGDENYGYN